jgi:uracil-DNA glycosylase family 4
MGTGPVPADLMIIGEAPGKEEDRLGIPFVGAAGQLLDQLLGKAAIDRDRAYITNVVKCRPPENRTPTPQEIHACARHLQREIDAVRPRYILLLGNSALKAILGSTGITSHRGRASHHGATIVLSTFHPASVFRVEANRSIIQQDLHYLRKIMLRGSIPRETELNPVLVDTPARVDQLLDALSGVVAFDIETRPADGSTNAKDGLYPWKGEITALGFGTKAAQFALLVRHRDSVWSPDDIDNILTRAIRRLEHCFVVGQNIKFDQLWVLIHYGIFIEADFDTMLAHYLLDENQPHDLEFLAQMYFQATAWDIPLADKQGAASAARLARYLANDLYYTRLLFEPLAQALARDRRLTRLFHHLLMPLANLFVRIEAQGACIDQRHLVTAETYLDGQIKRTQRELNKLAGQHINWRSTRAIAKLLYSPRPDGLGLRSPFTTKGGAPSTAESALNQLDHPLVSKLKEFRAATQEYSFFIKGWRPYIVESRGASRLHPAFKLSGTITGRASAEHPNLQQVTREPRVRSCITAPPGFVLMEADLSQIELRLVAHHSQDPVMIETFRTGKDIHWRTALREIERAGAYPELVLSTASTLSQREINFNYGEAMQILLEAGPEAAAEIDKQWKNLRYTAKATNFGFVYGMWWRKFRMYARDTYGIDITDRQAQDSRNSFFNLYASLEKWHNYQKRYAKNQGYVRSLDGQLRRLPAAQDTRDSPEQQEAFRQAINSPIQGFAAKINFMVLLQMCEEFSWSVFRPVATVHDAILAEVRLDHVEICAHRIEQIMRRPSLFDTFEIQLDVPLEGETKIGAWGSGVSLKKWLETQT